MKMNRPRYPVYIISKGRADKTLTAIFMKEDDLDFALVVEPQEYDDYRRHHPHARIHKLPFSNLG